MEIMKTFTSLCRASLVVTSVLLGSSQGLFAAEIVLQKVPPLTVEQAPAYPENLARHHLGARLEAASNSSKSEDGKPVESPLLSGDPTASYELSTGTTTLLVALPKIENVGSISFVNKGTKGSVAIATSNAKLPADSPQWRNAVTEELSTDGLQAKVGPSEAKYVRMTFNVTEPGSIAGFGIYAYPQVSDFTAPRTRTGSRDKSGSFGLVSYSYTDMHAKARALYVSSGSDLKQANNMIDDQTATTYTFAAEDGSPTTVIDLGKAVSLRRLSAVYSPRAGNMAFFVLQSLPAGSGEAAQGNPAGTESDPVPTPDTAPQTITLNDANLKAVGSAADDGSQGRASIEFPAVSGRYVLVRWTPAAQPDGSFALAEIAAFGSGSQGNTLLAANTESSAGGQEETDDYAEGSDGKTMLDGKTMTDYKDMPGEGPQNPNPPPTLPQTPPFTFVPIIVPNSR